MTNFISYHSIQAILIGALLSFGVFNGMDGNALETSTRFRHVTMQWRESPAIQLDVPAFEIQNNMDNLAVQIMSDTTPRQRRPGTQSTPPKDDKTMGEGSSGTNSTGERNSGKTQQDSTGRVRKDSLMLQRRQAYSPGIRNH